MADVLGRRHRPKVPVPFLSPRLSSLWIGLVTPVDAGVARPLIEGLSTPTVVTDPSAAALFDVEPMTLRRGAAPRPRRGHGLAEAPAQAVEQRLEREVLEHVALQPPARLVAQRDCSRSAAPTSRPCASSRSGVAAGRRSAPGPRSRSRPRPGRGTTRPTSSRLRSSDAVWARRRARRACVSNSRASPALPRLGSFSSRAASSSFTAASAAAPRSAARSSSGRQGAAITHSASSCSGQRRARGRLGLARAARRLRPGQRARRDRRRRRPAARTRAPSRRATPSRLQLLRDARRRDRAEADRPAARGNRLQQAPGRRADQHEVRERRRAPRASSAASSATRRSCGPRPTITNTRRRDSNGPQRRLAHDLRRARRRPGCRARRAARPR